MANIKSNNIAVFPCVGRGVGFDPEAELTNEGNLTQIIRSLYKRDSFVISDSIGFSDSGALSKDFEFVIYGFYFKVKAAANTESELYKMLHPDENTHHPLYAGIRIDQSSTTYQLLSLKNGETADIQTLDNKVNEDNYFQGIVFDISEENVKKALKLESGTSDDNIKILYLFKYNDDTKIWETPNSFKLHFKTSEILNINADNTETPLSANLTTNTLTVSTGIINDLTTTSLETNSLSGTYGTITNLTTNTLTVSTELNVTGSLTGEIVKTSNIANNAVTTEKLGFSLTTSNIGTSSAGEHTVEFIFSNKD